MRPKRMIPILGALLCAAFPAFRQSQVVDKWAGYIDATPDAVARQPGGRQSGNLS